MKTILKTILKYYLKFIAKFVLFINKPIIIAVAGSTNKYFTKEAIKDVLEKKGETVRVSPNNFNTEIGLSLSILDLSSGYNSYKDWLPIIFKAIFSVFAKNYPKYLVLELGTSDPGDMRFLVSVIKPYVVVITDINQRYIESFSDMDKLVLEYQALVNGIAKNGYFISNNDNIRVKSLKYSDSIKHITFGSDKDSDCRVLSAIKISKGQEIDYSYKNHNDKLSINRFGEQHIASFLIANIIQDII